MITQEQKNKLTAYSELKLRIKELEAEADTLNPEVLDIMQMEGVEEVEVGDLGKLTLCSKRKWSYTPEVKAKEEELKGIKKRQEQTGEASYVETHYPKFNSSKEE